MKTKTCQKQMKKKKQESKRQHFRGVHNQVFYHTVAADLLDPMNNLCGKLFRKLHFPHHVD
jgi:hypothetical protein